MTTWRDYDEKEGCIPNYRGIIAIAEAQTKNARRRGGRNLSFQGGSVKVGRQVADTMTGWLREANAYMTRAGFPKTDLPEPIERVDFFNEDLTPEDIFHIYALRVHQRLKGRAQNLETDGTLGEGQDPLSQRSSIPSGPDDEIYGVDDAIKGWVNDYRSENIQSEDMAPSPSLLTPHSLGKAVFIGGFEYIVQNDFTNLGQDTVAGAEHNNKIIRYMTPDGYIYRHNLEKGVTYDAYSSHMNRQFGKPEKGKNALNYVQDFLEEAHVHRFGLMREPMWHMEHVQTLLNGSFEPKDNAKLQAEIERTTAEKERREKAIIKRAAETLRLRNAEMLRLAEEEAEYENFYGEGTGAGIF